MNFSKIFLSFCFVLSLLTSKSQHGLEKIIVEKYYVSSADDTLASRISGFLPIGSTTYRIYLDMLPSYKFYAAYGSKGHPLKIETSTNFFNNEDMGKTIPNVIPQRTLKRNTVMLDSWLSAGAAGESCYGILKTQDDTLETIKHEKLFLRNNSKKAGLPLNQKDGLLLSTNVPFPVFFGIDSLAPIFYNSTSDSHFSTENGAWGCLGGAVGQDSLTTNRLLIAQLTTDGILSFELNIQIGIPGVTIERYVAANPGPDDISISSLTYTSKKTRFGWLKNNKSDHTKSNKKLLITKQ